jgi:hypothetical protein
METLTCSHGHSFSRIVTRGRKPVLCPAHKAAETVEAGTPSPDEVPALASSLTGVDRAAKLFESMAVLVTKTNRTVLHH